jgi:hypothetical protein
MKKIFFIFILTILVKGLSAQIKVSTGGNIVMCKPTNPSNTVIIGNPTPLWVPAKLQIKNNNLPVLSIEHWYPDQTKGVVSVSTANQPFSKHWVVEYAKGVNFYVTTIGDVYAKNKQLNGSDSIFKFNVNNIINPYEKILQLRGVTYQIKPHAYCEDCITDTLSDSATTQPVRYGFIAQEVERVVPEVVSTMDDSTKAIEYTAIIPLLLEGIKYQGQLITTLQNQVSQLTNSYSTISSYQTQIESLQTQINTITNNNTLSNYQAQIDAIQSQLNECCSTQNTLKTKTTNNGGQNYLGVDKNNGFNIAKAELYQNIPNPFNESSVIKFSIPESSKTAFIIVYDMQGKQLKKYSLTKGSSQVFVAANEYKAGMYLYSLIVDHKEIDTKRMIITD